MGCIETRLKTGQAYAQTGINNNISCIEMSMRQLLREDLLDKQ